MTILYTGCIATRDFSSWGASRLKTVKTQTTSLFESFNSLVVLITAFYNDLD